MEISLRVEVLKLKFFLDELPFLFMEKLQSGRGGEMRGKVGRVALGTRKGSGPRMKGRICRVPRGVVGTILQAVRFIFLAGCQIAAAKGEDEQLKIRT